MWIYNSGCITCDTIAPLINERTKAICVVHLAGWPTDIEKIAYLAKENNLYLIEDCSQAHGAFIGNKSVGSFGDISIWSFCTDKIISTGGEGGMAGTNSLNYLIIYGHSRTMVNLFLNLMKKKRF